MGLILLVLVSIILTACTYRWYKQNGVLRKLHWIPKVPGLPVLGNIWDFGKTTDFLNVISRYCEKYNGLCWIDLVRTKNIIISDYKILEVVLSNMSILNKPREYSFFHSWLGSGLLTAESEKWKKTRKMLTPAFHFSILEQFVEIFESNGRILVDLLEKETDKSYVNVYPFLTLATLDIICESAMGVSINAQKNSQSDYVRATKEMCRIVAERPFSALKMFHTLYPLSKDYYKEQRCLKILHTQSESVIKERRELKNKIKAKAVKEEIIGAKKKMAFLDMLLEARINGEPLTDREIRDEVETFMFEGHDTTSSAIGFTLYCLAANEEVQSEAIEEQKRIFGKDKDKCASYRELQEMKYLEMVIKESLRLYPSVPYFARDTNVDVKYEDGKVIPAGVGIVVFVFGANRNPKAFPDPEKFNPRRFDGVNSVSPYAYVPFSAGPRNCIGQKFAMLEMKSTVSKILRNFVLSQSGPKPILAAEAILKSSNGINVCLKKRDWISLFDN